MINVLIPDMPSAEELLPYLRELDRNRVYVNNGPMVRKLEAVLQAITGVPCVALSSGTAALELIFQTLEDECGVDTAMMPALTFKATGLAASRAGLGVKLSDVDAACLQMTPKSMPTYAHGIASTVYCPVATFGRPVELSQWENHDVLVVVDAAGAFPSQQVSKNTQIATCFSLHATKFIGCSEGGFLATNNPAWEQCVRDLRAFGPYGTNAKMSEYHAAVALASLDSVWVTAKMARTEQVATWYAELLKGVPVGTPYLSRTSTLFPVMLPASAKAVGAELLAAGIETRQWYRPYLDELDFDTLPLPVTDRVRDSALGLPFHNFLTQDEVAYVCGTLRKALL